VDKGYYPVDYDALIKAEIFLTAIKSKMRAQLRSVQDQEATLVATQEVVDLMDVVIARVEE